MTGSSTATRAGGWCATSASDRLPWLACLVAALCLVAAPVLRAQPAVQPAAPVTDPVAAVIGGEALAPVTAAPSSTSVPASSAATVLPLELPLRPPSLPWAADEGAVLVRDEAGIFDAPAHGELKAGVLKLRRDTGVDLFVVTRGLSSLEEMELTAYEVFKSLVREVQHYKVVLVLVGIDRTTRQGVVSTNLGAGVYHLIDKKDCEGIFAREGAPFSADTILRGVEYLCARIERAEDERRATERAAGVEPARSWQERLGPAATVAVAAGAVALAVAFVWWLAVRTPLCPTCGAELRKRVTIVMGTGGNDVARRTYKCFNCGYTKRRAILPSVLMGRKKG